MAAALLSPCLGCGVTSCLASCCASCACSLVTQACCSLAGCFCPRSARVGKLFYLLLFCAAAVLGIVLRYEGQQAIGGSWTPSVVHVCDSDANGASACYGLQAAYRISAALCGFFFIMALLVCLVPVAHHGAWLLKLALFLLMLGCSLLIPNSFFSGYAELSRYGSIVFLVIQVILIIDFAYAAHEWLLRKADETDRKWDAAGWEMGALSNCWKTTYVGVSALLACASIAGIGVLFKYFGQCPLMQFFLSETLIVGVILAVASVWGASAKGLLPPCFLFAYNTYLVYGALTNNPDASCNIFASSAMQSQASIITGLVIAVVSITWAAYSSAGGLVKAVSSSGGAGSSVSAGVAASPVPTRGDSDVERGSSSPSHSKPAAGSAAGASKQAAASATAADYAAPPQGEAEEEAGTPGSGGAAAVRKPAAVAAASVPAWGAAGAPPAAEAAAEAVEPYPWLFHLTLAFAGLYLAMLMTNWGALNTDNGNPEMSLASMWVRMVSQWLIYALYAWTLVAPACCPGRDFS